jgi:hypothetical protein
MARDPSGVPRVLPEVLAIILSILIAFGIDAWWQDRRERESEQAALESLHAEFSQNLIELDTMVQAHRDRITYAERLLALSRADSLDPNPLTMDTLIYHTFVSAGSYNARQGVLSALLASGDLGLIEDQGLRERLGSWSGELDDLVEEEQWIFRDIQERWVPALLERIPLGRVYAVGWDEPVTEAESDYRAILGDPLLENYVLTRIDSEKFVLRDAVSLRALIEEILDMAETSVAR